MKTFLLIRSNPASAADNMALDEKILARYCQDRTPVFRVYRWQSPSFTYGISQDPKNEIDLKKCSADGVEIAQRMTGGGILFHHDEITYSFVCAKKDVGEPQGRLVSYKQICAFLIRFYESLGLKACFALDADGFQKRCVPGAICNASHEKYDVVIGAKKIGGNAQKRKRDVIFQHGSVSVSIDWDFVGSYLRSLPKDMSSTVTTLGEQLAAVPEKDILEEKLIKAFGRTFGVTFVEDREYSSAFAV